MVRSVDRFRSSVAVLLICMVYILSLATGAREDMYQGAQWPLPNLWHIKLASSLLASQSKSCLTWTKILMRTMARSTTQPIYSVT